jgi:hypothetical protein
VAPTIGTITATPGSDQSAKRDNAELEWRQADIEDFAPTPARAHHAKADQVRMARDVAAMFEDMRAVADKHAELHADRARLQAELERAHGELEQARRPWWWRIIKS